MASKSGSPAPDQRTTDESHAIDDNARPPVRVLSWNLWWRFGDYQARQEPIAKTLADSNADIICVQEVWAKEGHRDQAAWLAERLGMHHVRHDTAQRDGLSFANAVLSRWPISASESHPLPGTNARPSHRHVIHAEIDSPRGPVHVFSTHLDQRFDNSALRQEQLRMICALMARVERNPETDFPLVLAGDLNAVPDSDEIRTLTGRRPPYEPGMVLTDAWEVAGQPTGDPGWTWRADNPLLAEAQWPNRRLDYILTSWPRRSGQGTPIEVRLIGSEPVDGVMPSDHAGVLAVLR
jgi:endonuclease/exonuclease/phosphatase family metal-dependent hydrolase